MVAENDHGKRFTATFRAVVILHMLSELLVFNTGPYTVLPDNSILITANMQSETGFPSSHQLKSYIASKSRLKYAARAVLSADAGLLVPKVILVKMLAYASYFDNHFWEGKSVLK